jgi:hypothetical protein
MVLLSTNTLGITLLLMHFLHCFPTGVADIVADQDEKVEMKDWALHLIKLKDGCFARHPQFQCWVLNTMMHLLLNE